MRKQLTVAMIDREKPPESGRKEINDTIIPQLALRITSDGAKSFTVRTRVRQKQIRYTIGDASVISLVDARDQARDALLKARNGEDPREVRRDKERENLAATDQLFSNVAAEFIERYAKRNNKTWRDSEAIFRIWAIPAWGEKLISEITRKDVAKLLDAVEDHVSLYRANRVLAAVRKLFNWAVARDLLNVSPVVPGMARKGEKARERYLSPHEIRTVWLAAERVGYPFGTIAQLLLLTGQRRGEVASMSWDQLDLDHERVWTIPAEETKAGREHIVPLTDMALATLTDIPRYGEYVLTTRGDRPISGFTRGKQKIDVEIVKFHQGRASQSASNSNAIEPLPEWRMHDLRRTVATHMEDALGIAPHIIGAVLNHDPKGYKGVTAVYTKGNLVYQRRRALSAWSRFLGLVLDEEAWPQVESLLRVQSEKDAAVADQFRNAINADEEAWTTFRSTKLGVAGQR
jgi:integrase